MAKKLVRLLRTQHPDYHYLKKVFQHTRVLLEVGPAPPAKRLPALLTDAKLVAFYDTIWQARQLTHVAMLKLLLFTGIRNAELVQLRQRGPGFRHANRARYGWVTRDLCGV
jgi:integrase/recombinase XerD